jgi:hypothetical protein
MQQIASLMKELNLGEDVILTTLTKIDYICSKQDYSDFYSSTLLRMNGNGDGNGNGNN